MMSAAHLNPAQLRQPLDGKRVTRMHFFDGGRLDPAHGGGVDAHGLTQFRLGEVHGFAQGAEFGGGHWSAQKRCEFDQVVFAQPVAGLRIGNPDTPAFVNVVIGGVVPVNDGFKDRLAACKFDSLEDDGAGFGGGVDRGHLGLSLLWASARLMSKLYRAKCALASQISAKCAVFRHELLQSGAAV